MYNILNNIKYFCVTKVFLQNRKNKRFSHVNLNFHMSIFYFFLIPFSNLK